MGWRGHVIAAKQYSYERYDPALLAMIPTGTEVIRVPGRYRWQAFQAWRACRTEQKYSEPSAEVKSGDHAKGRAYIRSLLREMLPKVEAWSYHPDRAMLWIGAAVTATVALCSRTRPDAIWATAGPVSSFIVAQRASHRTGIPYVLDFRDSWTVTYSEFEARRPAWALRCDQNGMHRLLKGAHAVTFRYHTEAECYWRAYPGALDASRIHIIPNGYENNIDQCFPSKGNRCKVLYAGTLTTYRYDTLLEALCSFKQSSPDMAKLLHLQFVGEGAELLAREAASLCLSDIISTSGPIPQDVVSEAIG